VTIATAEAFWRDGYLGVADLLTPEQCEFVKTAMDASARSGHMRDSDNRAYQGPNNQYAPPPGQALLAALAPRASNLVGKKLLPGYSFWRIYENGAELRRHRDRPACEVSATVTIAAKGEWPFCLSDLSGTEREITLQPGAALLYQGVEVPHWRAPLTTGPHYQLFLHYVVDGGPYATHAHDYEQLAVR
jgi:hypothetical protein